ncbi:MAG TPA: hypothetical protein VND65_00395 [Candidatus Binatia bacterium]|nr:hypothetical protein [Candidatus Binatia bacterium]
MAKSRSVAFTLRMGIKERAALRSLSKIEGRPINQLLNAAIKNYLNRKGQKEQSLTADLARLRAYRKKDPDLEKAIAAFAEAEARFEDPLEGESFDEPSAESGKQASPAQNKIRDILGA